MDVLRELIESLRYKDTTDVYVPRSEIFYTRSLIREKFGIEMDVLDVERMLMEEGLLKKKHVSRTYQRNRG